MFGGCQTGLAILNQAKPKRITIALTTDGGCVYEAFGIYDLIRSNPIPVDVHAVGYCMSAGPVILQAGTKRTATENTQFMIHLGQESVSGEVATVRAAQKHLMSMGRRMQAILGARVDIDRNALAELIEETTYMSEDEAQSYGLIDEVTQWP